MKGWETGFLAFAASRNVLYARPWCEMGRSQIPFAEFVDDLRYEERKDKKTDGEKDLKRD